jgi:hypothetical protein
MHATRDTSISCFGEDVGGRVMRGVSWLPLMKEDVMPFEWSPKVDLGNILSGIGFLLTFVTVLFAGLALRKTVRVQRADFLLKLTERYFKSEEVRDFYYQLDWDKWSFSLDQFIASKEERLLDSLLYSFDEIGQVLRLGVLDKTQARIFAFQASRVLGNEEVQKYLRILDADYRDEGLSGAHPDARYLVSRLIPERRVSTNRAS